MHKKYLPNLRTYSDCFCLTWKYVDQLLIYFILLGVLWPSPAVDWTDDDADDHDDDDDHDDHESVMMQIRF